MKETSELINDIHKFLSGHNEKLKYLVNVETFPYTNYATCIIHEPNKNPYIHRERFKPFLYLKDLKKYGIELYNGNRDLLIENIEKYGIEVKKLETGNQPRLENGFVIQVSSNISYNSILQFLKAGGLDMWQQDDDLENKNKHLFYTLTLDEQFFISTGIRLFKGYEKYSQVHKLIFDIETTDLKPYLGRIFMIGVRDNKGFETLLKVNKENDDNEERILIEKFFRVVENLKPAVIAGYNSEDFDFYFIIERAKILGIFNEQKIGRNFKYLSSFQTTLNNEKDQNNNYKHNITRKPFTSVKFGNTAEKYTATQMWGYSIIDIFHAVKRTAAVNTEIKETKLKYIAKFEDVAKHDRMYIDGDKISEIWRQNKIYISNPINNKYEIVPDELQNCSKLILNLQRSKETLSELEYVELRNNTLKNVSNDFIEWQKSKIEKYTNKYKLIYGLEIVERYLLDDLWETDRIDDLYNQCIEFIKWYNEQNK
jgi:DNA polymerase elongation subunit (family B)